MWLMVINVPEPLVSHNADGTDATNVRLLFEKRGLCRHPTYRQVLVYVGACSDKLLHAVCITEAR